MRTAITILLNIILVAAANGQRKKNDVQSIKLYVSRLNADTTIKHISIPKDELEKSPFVTTKITIYIKNDSLVKVTEWILHPPMKQFDYYFKNNKLVLFSFHQEEFCGQNNIFYETSKMIKIESKNCSFYDNRTTGNHELKEANKLYNFFSKRIKIITAANKGLMFCDGRKNIGSTEYHY